MQQHRKDKVAQTTSTSRPGAFSLLKHILRGAVSDGMQWPAIVCIGLTIALYHEQIPYHEAISGLLLSGLLLVGLVRGCARWQQDLVAYRRDLLLSRHRQSKSDIDYTIPGFVPFTRR